MLLITILSTIILICILLFPSIKYLYHLISLGKKKLEEQQSQTKEIHSKKSDLSTSILGKSKFNLCQPLPIAATTVAKELIIEEDGHNFATDENQTPMDIDIPLEKEPEEEDYFDEDEEAIELEEMFGKDVCFAAGIDINDLDKVKHVIETPSPDAKEKQEAGKVLYENKETDMFEQLASGKTKVSSIISNLIDIHIALHLKEKGEFVDQSNEFDELKNFDVNMFLKN